MVARVFSVSQICVVARELKVVARVLRVVGWVLLCSFEAILC